MLGDDDDVVDACAGAADDVADLIWSLTLSGHHFETHWNDLLIVRCDFGGNLDVVVAVAFDLAGCDHDCRTADVVGVGVDVATHCSHSYALAFGVHNAVTERPDCLSP